MVDLLTRLAEDVHAALASRAVIDQAIGILMSRLGVSADEASNRLRALSQREPANVAEVAAGRVQAAMRRAQARRPDLTFPGFPFISGWVPMTGAAGLTAQFACADAATQEFRKLVGSPGTELEFAL